MRAAWNAGLGLAAAIGLVVGVRSIAAWTATGPEGLLRLTPLRVHDLGITWSDSAVLPPELQSGALEALVGTVAALALACAALGLLNTVIVLADAASARTGADAVRLAIGASPSRLAAETLRRMRTLALAAGSAGLLSGAVVGLTLRAAWPGTVVGLADGSIGWDLLLALAFVWGITVVAALSGVSAVRKPGRAAGLLRQGRQAGAAPGAVFLRSALSSVHIGVGATCLLAALVLLNWPSFTPTADSPDDLWVLETEVGGASLQELFGEIDAGDARDRTAPPWSDSSSGALLGLGIRDIVVTQCGNCTRSGLPAPLWTLRASNFAVGPGWFALAGIDLVEGRTFRRGAGPDDPREVVIEESVARSAFEGGDALGRQLRLGRDHATWYTVVGVVRAHTPDVLGADGARPAIYLNSRQIADGPTDVIVLGSEAAASTVADRLDGVGALVAAPRTLNDFVDRHVHPYRWLGALAAALGTLALLLAAHGSWVASLQSTQRRRAEFALRRAIGASDRSILSLAARERLRIIGFGLFLFSLLGTAAIAGVGSSVFATGPRPFVLAGGWLGAISFAATIHAARLATRVPPARALD